MVYYENSTVRQLGMNKKAKPLAYKEVFVSNRAGDMLVRPTPFYTRIQIRNNRIERFDNMIDSLGVMRRAITNLSICHLK